MKSVRAERAPAPAGHYSQAMIHGGLVFVSGQLPIGPDGRPLADASVAEQTRVVLENVGTILEAAGSELGRVVQVTIYVSDIEHWPAVDETYAEVFGGHRPARAVVPVPGLHHGVALEVQAIAALL
jgi:reactive intermediate/imine deaminase